MEREFKCKKCESVDVYIKLKDYVSRGFHDEYVPEFLACSCRRCGNYWKEEPSDKKK